MSYYIESRRRTGLETGAGTAVETADDTHQGTCC